jgi:tetratricopeptide (TPR) repeat protein
MTEVSGQLDTRAVASGGDRALKLYEEGLTASAAGDEDVAVMALHMQAEMLRAERRYDEAVALYEQSIARRRAIGDEPGITMELYNMGAVLALGGDPDRAEPLLRESLERARAEGGPDGEGQCLYSLIGLARAAAGRGHPVLAARMLGAANTGLERRGEVLDPAEEIERGQIERLIVDHLEPGEAAAAQRGGAALTLDEAIAEALGEGPN